MAEEWDNTERRTLDHAHIYQQLGELQVRVSHIETSLDKLDRVSQQLDDFTKQAHGVMWVLRGLFYIVGPIVAAMYWIKDHVR